MPYVGQVIEVISEENKDGLPCRWPEFTGQEDGHHVIEGLLEYVEEKAGKGL